VAHLNTKGGKVEVEATEEGKEVVGVMVWVMRVGDDEM
jgi:hypothetical protein